MDITLEKAQYSEAQYTINMNVEELYAVRQRDWPEVQGAVHLMGFVEIFILYRGF